MFNVYLDDLRDIPKDYFGVRTFEDGISVLKNFEVNILSLDHDLGCDQEGIILKTGYDLVKWICEFYNEYNLSIKYIYIHTDNPVGRENMYETLNGAKRRGFLPDSLKIFHYSITENKYTGD